MRLKHALNNIRQRSDQESLKRHLQLEFESLVATMKDYYDTQKQLIEFKKQRAFRNYELALLKIRYKQIKAELINRQKNWMILTAQYA